MSEEKLIYDSDGTYRIGESLTQMDVVKNAGKSRAADAQPKPPRRPAAPKASSTSTAKRTSKASGSVAPAQTASKGFDLNAYRRQAKAAKGAAAEEPKEQEAPKAPAKRATKAAGKKTAEAEVKPVPETTTTPPPVVDVPPANTGVEESAFGFKTTVPLKERELSPAPEDTGSERQGLAAMDLSHIKESAVREDMPQGAVDKGTPQSEEPTTIDEDASLESAVAETLGAYADQAADEAVAQQVEADLIEELTGGSQSIKPEPPAEFQAFESATQPEWERLNQTDRRETEPLPMPIPVVEVLTQEVGEAAAHLTDTPAAPDPVPEEPKLEGVQRADDNVNQGHFDVVPAGELLANGGSVDETPRHLRDWLYRVIDAKVRNPTAVFDCKDLAGLRAYYVLQDGGRNPDILVAIGCGNRVSAVAINSTKTSLADIATRISIQGALAIIGDGVAAIYGQRNERTITL